MKANKINFQENWNNKLSSTCFSTVRLQNDKFKEGKIFEIYMKGRLLGTAELVHIKVLRLDQVNESISRIDADLNVEDFKKLMQTLYKNYSIFWREQLLQFLVLRWVVYGEFPVK